jgi:hypothetical protein
MDLKNDRFSFWVPAEVMRKGDDPEGKRWIQGIASTDHLDLQGEIVDQDGIDFSYFLKYGYFNNDHKPGFENKVGQPTECKVTNKGLWVKGFLLKKHQVADSIWELLTSLKESNSARKVGFSIQGKVLRRNGNKISKCWIQDIAITPSPVNPTTWAEVAKSLAAQDWAVERPTVTPRNVNSLGSKNSMEKSLSYEDAVIYLQVKNGLTRNTAIKVADYAFSLYGKEHT